MATTWWPRSLRTLGTRLCVIGNFEGIGIGRNYHSNYHNGNLQFARFTGFELQCQQNTLSEVNSRLVVLICLRILRDLTL